MASPSPHRCGPCPGQRTPGRSPVRGKRNKPQVGISRRQNRCRGCLSACGSELAGLRSVPPPVKGRATSRRGPAGRAGRRPVHRRPGSPRPEPCWARQVFSTATIRSTCSSLTGVVADCGPSSSRTSCGWIDIVALPSEVVLLSGRRGGDRPCPQQPREPFPRHGFRHADRTSALAATLVQHAADHVVDEVGLIGVGRHEPGDQVVSTVHRWLSHVSPGLAGVGWWT